MSKEYRETTGLNGERKVSEEMRLFCQRPGRKDEDGKPLYFTEQSHKDHCNVNHIINKYDKTGILTHMNTIEAKFGDMTGNDYKTMLDTVLEAKRNFKELPSNIRKRFDNNPEKLLAFMENPANRDEAIKLGLIDGRWSEATDGLGEHIKSDSERQDKIQEGDKA